MIRRQPTTLLVLLLSSVVAGAVNAQELFYLKSSLDSQASAAGGSARELLDELLAQPPEVRNAVLEAAQFPELLVRLKYADAASPEARDSILAEYPPPAAEAARVLLANPPLMKKVGDRIVAAGLLGQMYAKERETVRQMADQLSQQRAELSAASAKAWHERLAADQTAGTQLRTIIEARPGEAVGSEQPVGTPGLHFPNGEQAGFILANADQYPELAAQVVDQWERERNPDDFRIAVDFWYARNRPVLPGDFLLSRAELVNLLKEHAVFERRYLETAAIAGSSMPDRATYLDANLQDYPLLSQARQAKIIAESRAKKSRVVGGPYTGSSSSRSGGSSSGGGLSSGDSSMRSSRSNSMRGSSSGSRSRNSRNNNDSGQFGGGGGFGNDSGFGNEGGFGNNSRFGGSSGGRSGGSNSFGSGGRSGGSNSFGSGGRSGGSNSSFGSGNSQSGGSRFGSRQSGSRFGGSNNSSNNSSNNR